MTLEISTVTHPVVAQGVVGVVSTVGRSVPTTVVMVTGSTVGAAVLAVGFSVGGASIHLTSVKYL